MISTLQIDDLETLRAASEDDLRKAGLKMGDIIKIRSLLAKKSESSQSMHSELYESGSNDLDSSATSIKFVLDVTLSSNLIL